MNPFGRTTTGRKRAVASGKLQALHHDARVRASSKRTHTTETPSIPSTMPAGDRVAVPLVFATV